MKKYILYCVLSCFLLCACGEKETTPTPTSESASINSDSISHDEIDYSDETINDTTIYDFTLALTLSINPQVTVYLNDANIIVGVTYDNDDAYDAYSELDIIGLPINEAMPIFVDTSIKKQYLKENGNISIELSDIGEDASVADDSLLVEANNAVTDYLDQTEFSCEVEISISEEITKKYGLELSKQPCQTCNGTGIICPGDPKFGKSRGNGNGYAGCGGTGICPCPDINCHNGTYTDPNCGGSGKQTCFGCGGSGCVHCNNTGQIECEYCSGKGVYPHHEFCYGTGTCECITIDLHTPCTDCDGTGLK